MRITRLRFRAGAFAIALASGGGGATGSRHCVENVRPGISAKQLTPAPQIPRAVGIGGRVTCPARTG